AAPNVLRVERDYVQNWLQGAPALPALSPAFRAAAPAPAAAPRAQALPWGIQRVNAPGAWPVTRGAGVKVAVVDTGIDFDHPDLKVAGGANMIDPSKSFKDDNGHGTHVSGTIAGQGKDDVWGVAPDVSLYGVKVLDANGSGTFADVIAGIQWTAQNHMDVANFSLGASQGTQALADAVKAATDAGVTIVAAAGNSGAAVGYPGAYPQCIAVAASDSSDAVADFSSRGPQVAVLAPGVNVYSTYMGGGYQSLDGTSMATPHVTGLTALAIAARGVHGQAAVRKALQAAATPVPNASADEQGAGIVDAAKLVR
ncbi:MAG: S8 family peptidase, partial [Elusimicrobia bacterium]|nr:S8 family peptidase [Elusimicrobiota bacterium]